MKSLFPSRALILFLAIGFTDLVVTAVLHAQGQIVELNPLMKVFIERSEWLFALVKGLTLVAGWWALASYAKKNLDFVRKAALWGSAAYITVWTVWFFGAAGTPAPVKPTDRSVERPYEGPNETVIFV